MKLFLDANLIVAVLNKECPLYEYAAKVLSLADRPNTTLFISPVSVAIAFYFASKKSGQVQAKRKLSILLDHVTVSTVNHDMTHAAIREAKVQDVEDGIQFFSAVHHDCDYILTENVEDFHFSTIPVMKADAFLMTVGLS